MVESQRSHDRIAKKMARKSWLPYWPCTSNADHGGSNGGESSGPRISAADELVGATHVDHRQQESSEQRTSHGKEREKAIEGV